MRWCWHLITPYNHLVLSKNTIAMLDMARGSAGKARNDMPINWETISGHWTEKSSKHAKQPLRSPLREEERRVCFKALPVGLALQSNINNWADQVRRWRSSPNRYFVTVIVWISWNCYRLTKIYSKYCKTLSHRTVTHEPALLQIAHCVSFCKY